MKLFPFFVLTVLVSLLFGGIAEQSSGTTGEPISSDVTCESKTKEYTIEAVGSSITSTSGSDTLPPASADVEKAKAEAKKSCEENMLFKSTNNVNNCTSFCNQWDCSSRYTHDPLVCNGAVFDKKEAQHLPPSYELSWYWYYVSKGRATAKCQCKTEPAPTGGGGSS